MTDERHPPDEPAPDPFAAPDAATVGAALADSPAGASARAVADGASGPGAEGTPPPKSLSEAVGGPLGLAESILPPTAFVVAYLVAGQEVRLAAIVAAGIAVVLALARLVRGQTLQFALSGLVGIAIAAFVVSRTGRPQDFFLPSLLWNVAYGGALLVSIALRWPLVGLLIGSLRGEPTAWREDRARRALYTRVTWMWVGLFVARIVVKTPLYLAGSVVALGVVHLAMGVPLYLLGLWITWLLVRADVGGAPTARPAAG